MRTELPRKPLSPCAQHGCPELTDERYCDSHAGLRRQAWQTSHRKARRQGSGWEEQARHKRIMRQHQGICHVCNKPGADQVDHVIPLSQGGTDEDDNLAPIHAYPCHKDKTAREAQQARSKQWT